MAAKARPNRLDTEGIARAFDGRLRVDVGQKRTGDHGRHHFSPAPLTGWIAVVTS